MKAKIACIVIYLVILFSLSNFQAIASQLEARQIITRSFDLYRLAPYETEEIGVTVVEDNGRTQEKKIVRWLKYSNGGDKLTVKFVEPEIDKGLGLLIWHHHNSDDEQWLKLPSLHKVMRLQFSNQTKFFGGTDFTFEDISQLAGEKVENFVYSFIRKDDTGWVIKATPKSPATKTRYDYRMFWVNSNFVISRIEYYSYGQVEKTQRNSEITIDKNGLWRSNRIEVDNKLLDRKTVMTVVKRDFPTKLSERIFTTGFLTSERR